MNRKLIALAAAAVFAPALALADGSSVVLTGVIHGDIGFGEEKADDGTKLYKRQANIGSFATRWEIDGTEDLGWSKAIFGLAMDQKFSGPQAGGSGTVTNNNQISDTAVSNRNSYIGLTGGWGTLKIGQNEHVYEIQQILQDPDPASESTFGTLTLMTNYGVGTSGPKGFTRRDPQSVWYTSPSFGGVTIDAAYITPAGGKTDSGGTTISPQGFQLGANWKAPFGLSLYGAFAQYNDEGGADNKNRAARLGVGYGTDLFQVDVAGEQLKFTPNNVSGGEVKRNNFMVSGAVNLGQHHIRAAINIARKAKVGGNTLDDSQARLFYLGYGFTVSKRTEFQVIYGKIDNKKNASFGATDFDDDGLGHDLQRIGFGVRHSF